MGKTFQVKVSPGDKMVDIILKVWPENQLALYVGRERIANEKSVKEAKIKAGDSLTLGMKRR